MAKSKDKKPNILMIISDQLNPRVIGKYKEFYDFSHLEADVTPNIDNLAENGVLFESVYTPTPLCRPARAAFWTGLFPHQTNVFTNGKMFKDPKVKSDVPSVGSVFSQHGYETKHIGKRHDHGALHGFDYSLYGSKKVDEEHPAWPVNQDTYRDVYTTKKSVDFLNEYPEDGNPFFLVSDLCNPHNICGWVGENKGPHDDIDPPIELPPLPDNFEIDDIENRPEAIQYICCSHRRMKQASQWAKENYRHYLAAYLHYTQRLDRDVGEILEALEKRGDMDNTLIIFMADHGD